MNAPDLGARLLRVAEPRRRPDGTPYRSLPSRAVQQLADETAASIRQVERAALAADVIPERYTRNMTTLSPKDQVRLLDSTVCIVGTGGLGGSVAEILARIGVGRLRLVDGDHFEDSNLNRQRFAEATSMGQPKAEVARQRIADINPAVAVTACTDFLTTANGVELIADADIAIDCLDTLSARRDLQGVCRRQKIPMVSAAVAGESGQLTVIFPEDKGLAALYGDLTSATERGAETALGNLAFAVNMLASLECSEAIKILLHRPSNLRGRLLLFDLSDLTFEVVQLAG
ncbi:MAG: HesA/MoeB/ThiF family protein [Desulfobacterales bacterium]|jgi:molybdopterin/thiamine biosynthesis adenylyltransferase